MAVWCVRTQVMSHGTAPSQARLVYHLHLGLNYAREEPAEEGVYVRSVTRCRDTVCASHASRLLRMPTRE